MRKARSRGALGRERAICSVVVATCAAVHAAGVVCGRRVRDKGGSVTRNRGGRVCSEGRASLHMQRHSCSVSPLLVVVFYISLF